MGFHGNTIVFGHLPGFTMVFHGNTMNFSDIYHCFTMGFHCNTIVFRYLPWFTMGFHGNTVVSGHLLWSYNGFS